MASEGNKDVASEALSMEQSSTSAAKRKRGRPRKNEYTGYELPQRAQPIQSVPLLHSTSGSSIDPKMHKIQELSAVAQQAQGNRPGRPRNSANVVKTSNNQASDYSSAPLKGNSGKDDILGKRFVGKMTKKFPGFSLITVKVKDNQFLRGCVPDENNLRPIIPKDDLAPELPILRPSQARKQVSAVHMQAAPPVPIHLEDVTLAKPLQMRRPVEKTIAYMSSGVVAAVPVSVSPNNVATRILPRKDTESVIPPPSVAAVPVKSVRPVLASCTKMDNQNEVGGERSVNEFQKDSESSNGNKESSVKAEKTDSALVDVVVKDSPGERQVLNAQVTDAVKESSGAGDQPDSANTEHKSLKEPSDLMEQSERRQSDVLKGIDVSNSGASDDAHSVHDEHEMMVDSK